MAQDLHVLIVAAGSGSRVGGDVPKQYRRHRGKPLLRWSVEGFARDERVTSLTVAIGEGQIERARDVLDGLDIAYVTGGATRRDSVRSGLEQLAEAGASGFVFIHDAARADVPDHVTAALLAALESAPGAIPALPVPDSMIRAADGAIVEREALRRVQTPQAFHFDAILAAHRDWPDGREASDDAQMLRAAGGEVALVAGDERLKKVTFEEDFIDQRGLPALRIGTGYDVHRLVRGEELWLCGVQIDHEFGLSGHSDADVALHAITDAVLGAIGAGDIGSHFPPGDPQWRGARSDRFLAHAVNLATEASYGIGNIDCTIICEAPRIGPLREAMRHSVARIIGADPARISIKATTTEGLGYTGRREAIAAQACVLLEQRN
ncbi:bifunctional 2-C-methyl-D-erythritol 4-phosphate cytidylyltransferase/2-C-methyl-D-erythritol 2,4-cyclodiphosphate synthase [Novosphingopyxis sp.]|uniref:bifunctional 2-C-methyl-D-erythritol 4-phosphate cytidylyltransferase/2-C-methyl-D-erythritol 2,4-cyclodiphosphate synthase n=1 Tax=Novosphingopyxis sp. TaxID=2709690 RepID=UPI003B5BB573